MIEIIEIDREVVGTPHNLEMTGNVIIVTNQVTLQGIAHHLQKIRINVLDLSQPEKFII